MKTVDVVALLLIIVGALNWGLVGLARFDLVAAILGHGSILSAIVYTLVGLAGVYQLLQLKAVQRRWCSAVA
jgi:uncharacterized protein